MSDYIEALGIIAPKAVYKNLTPAQLVEHAPANIPAVPPTTASWSMRPIFTTI